ncbi:MAG: hypothetical protein WBS24_00980 [Terriglobales bacterium]
MTVGATLRSNEYAWTISSFPDAVALAVAHGYGCLGGQFQFRLADGSTCEMYWLNADSKERLEGESWLDYSRRSCLEVLEEFQKRLSETDFSKGAAKWRLPINFADDLVFVAYFVTETELAEISSQGADEARS